METKTVKAYLPFSGFYCTIHGDQIDSYVSYSEDGIENNYSALTHNYADLFTDQIAHELGIDLKFDKVISPREYNFVNDSIQVDVKLSDLKQLLTKHRQHLKKLAHERLERSDGFIPSYSQDITRWGDMAAWSQVQYELLLEAALLETTDLWEIDVVYNMSTDWQAI